MPAKLRLVAILVLLVAIPTVVVGWLAAALIGSEDAVLEKRFRELLRAQLSVYDERVISVLEAYERTFLEANSAGDLAADSLRRLKRSIPICSGLLALDSDGDILYPAAGRPLPQAERDLLLRVRRLVASGALIEPPVEIPQSPVPRRLEESGKVLQRLLQWRNRSQLPPVNQGANSYPAAGKTNVVKQGRTQTGEMFGSADTWKQGSQRVAQSPGWVPWFLDEGLQLYFRGPGPANTTLVFEVNRARLLADVIGTLPDTRSETTARSLQYSAAQNARIVLRDPHGAVIYHWGAYVPADNQQAAAALPVTFPLNSWRLEYFTDPAESPVVATRARRSFLLAFGTGGLALILALLSAYIYRESSRRMAEAATRVNFVNRVSHELRTPLTNIRLYAELVREQLDDQTDTKLRSFVATINQECARLSRLIGNVLSFSRQRKKLLKVSVADMDPCELVTRLLRQFGKSFEDAGMEFDLDLTYCPPLRADVDACEQILTNLLSNAEKYAAAGRTVRIQSRQEGRFFVLSVADNGPGIPKNMREKIFVPFVRLSDRLDEGVSGTGIGLSISRDLARAQGGDIRVADTRTGACFELFLPLSPEQISRPGPGAS